MEKPRSPVTLVRADIGQLARRAARQMIQNKKLRQQQELSGGLKQAMQGNPPTLTVLQESLPPYPTDPLRQPCVGWKTLAQPFGIETPLYAVGNASEAKANGWTLHELLTRRMHRALRNELLRQRVPGREANTVARSCPIYVAEGSVIAG